jgi:hypothetical protein
MPKNDTFILQLVTSFQKIPITSQYVSQCRVLFGNETSNANYQKYYMALKWMWQFLMEEYRVHDLKIKLINRQMVVKFEVFLRTKKLCNYNTTIKYLQNFKRIVMIGFKNGWHKINPFADFK